MAKYRDEVEAARLRADRLEAELAEQEAELTAREAAVVARDAKIKELEAKLDRQQEQGGGGGTAPQKKGGAAMLVAALALAILGAAIYMAMPSPGVALTIDVVRKNKSVGKANIYIDGQKVCEFAPCRTTVSPGQSLQIRAIVGNEEVSQSLTPNGDTSITLKVPDAPPPIKTPPPKVEPPPQAEPETTAEPADTAAAAEDCDCAPDDLQCNMRCTQLGGTLNVNSIPPSRVIVDGKPQGMTPLMGLKLKPGNHTVIFKHPELGTKSRSVTIKRGKVETATVRFDK